MPLHGLTTSKLLLGSTLGGPLSAAAAAAFLLDDYPGASIAFSFRKLRTAYAGSAVRIRRDSDDAEADIGFDVDGDFDTAAAATHIGGANGFIVTWYDQSGNGLNVTQATEADQPAYVASGINSLPSASYDGTDNFSSNAGVETDDFTNKTTITFFAVLNQAAGDANNIIFNHSHGGGVITIFPTFSDVLYFDFGTSGGGGRINVAQPGGWDDADHILECYRDTSDNQAIVVDGSELVTGSRTDDLTNGNAVFVIGSASVTFTGYVSEVVFYPDDIGSSDRTGARTNINTYYSVF